MNYQQELRKIQLQKRSAILEEIIILIETVVTIDETKSTGSLE